MTDPGVGAVRLRRAGRWVDDVLAVEEPLEIRLDGRPLAVLMRTPGEDHDLVAGFLATEGIIDGPDDLAALTPCSDPNRPARQNVMRARLAAGVDADSLRFDRARRELYAVSSCGLCGKASIDRIFQSTPPLPQRLEVPAEVVIRLPQILAAAQPRFAQTGGLHGAALCDLEGALICAREDVGRHNAVDKVLGARLRADAWPLDGLVLVVSSRAGFEIVQKAVVARIGAVIAVGAASTLAAQLATEANLALYSFVRGGRFNAH